MIYQYEKGSRARNYLLEHQPKVGWCWFLDLAPHHKRSESTLVQVLCSVFLYTNGNSQHPPAAVLRIGQSARVGPAQEKLRNLRNPFVFLSLYIRRPIIQDTAYCYTVPSLMTTFMKAEDTPLNKSRIFVAPYLILINYCQQNFLVSKPVTTV